MSDRSSDIAMSLVYNPYATLEPRLLDGYNELTLLQKHIVVEYVNHKKVIGSYSIAMRLIKDRYKNHNVTEDDIIWAYAVGAGGNMEYEFPYE